MASVVMGHKYVCQSCGHMIEYWTWVEGEAMRCFRCGRWQPAMPAYTTFPDGWCKLHQRAFEDCGCLKGGK